MQSKIAVLFFLAFMGLEDFKDQCVSLWKILLFLITGIFYFCIQYQWISIPIFSKMQTSLTSGFPALPAIFLSVLPGTALLLLCWISNGAIGLADGLIVLALGIWIGFWELLGVLSGAFFLSFFVAGFLFCFHKKNRTETIPFIPFLLVGMFLNLFFSQSV